MADFEHSLSGLREGPARFTPIALEAMTEAQRKVALEIMAGRKTLSGPFNAMLPSPDLAGPLQRLGGYLRFECPIPARLKELAIIIVARHWTAQYEWYAHRKFAEEAGLDAAKCDAIAKGRRPDDLDEDEAFIFSFTVMLLVKGAVSDLLFDHAVARLGISGATDLVGLIGYYTTISFMLNVDRHPLPADAVSLTRDGHDSFADILRSESRT